MNDIEKRKLDFFSQLKLSKSAKNNYSSALNGDFIYNIIAEVNNKGQSIFEITDLEILWTIYSKVNLHPANIAKHRGYSCAVMRYIRFLNDGKKYGKRIDADKPKGRRKKKEEKK